MINNPRHIDCDADRHAVYAAPMLDGYEAQLVDTKT